MLPAAQDDDEGTTHAPRQATTGGLLSWRELSMQRVENDEEIIELAVIDVGKAELRGAASSEVVYEFLAGERRGVVT
jgi:hypothetical protein